MTAVEIRQARVGDLVSIMGLESVFARGWSHQAWADEIEGHCVFITGEPVVGVAAFSVVVEVAEVRRIIVAEASRRSGLSRALMAHGLAAAVARGAREAFLEVSVNNHAAIALYRALGFQDLNRRVDYYGSGEDALVMGCSLVGFGKESRW